MVFVLDHPCVEPWPNLLSLHAAASNVRVDGTLDCLHG